MKVAISVSFVLFCLLLPSEGASNDDKNASPSTKVRFKVGLYDQILDIHFESARKIWPLLELLAKIR